MIGWKISVRIRCSKQLNQIQFAVGDKPIASIWNDVITVKYKVNCTEANINNRSETALFKTLEEAEKYCMECNTMERAAEF